VNDAVHVKVEAVEFGDAVLRDDLRDGWVALREPAEEFGNTLSKSIYVEVSLCGKAELAYP